ncbi:E3 ISG15--protein ligase Herc6 isoform X3 [Apis cerana]|uniref:E3 ISG15--protein ligase Herc6 isoform X3 n=1 Tax=Apis cerana TaxID=7461 RepID=UPI0007E2D980|nr:E3 ISG15--protein ligase Herc6 isoform X3 [Apis cerana]
MTFYYAGFNTSMLFSNNGNIIFIVDSFTKVPFSGITGFQIGWNYFLIWKGKELYISQKFEENNKEADSNFQLIQPLEKPLDSINQAAIGKDKIILLFDDNEIWQYKIYEKTWKKVINFICNSNDSENEYPVKIIQEECAVVLTNLENGDLYSMGMGTRGQLGHNDLEDCDNPKLVEALAGIKVTQISAAGWHSAVVTNQGDLYTWGWNTNGELGLTNQESKVIAVPTLIDFTNDKNESVEIFVEKAQCGNTFTICMTNDGTFWGCGCNKYGQLGQSPEKLANSMKFIKLDTSMIPGTIKDFKCREWGTILITN